MQFCAICDERVAVCPCCNLCDSCGHHPACSKKSWSGKAEEEKRKARNAKARARRAEIKGLMYSLGVKKVKGALGGTYWE